MLQVLCIKTSARTSWRRRYFRGWPRAASRRQREWR